MKKITILALVFLTVCSGYSKNRPKVAYKLINKISLEGNEKWDYLFSDDHASRLYVSHGSQVQIIDEVTGKMVGNIPGQKGVHGIAINPELNKGYITNGKDSSVTVFNIKTLEQTHHVKVGSNPDAILYDAFSKKVFVFNGHSNDISVIDVVTDKVVATIALTGNPEFSVTNGKGLIYVNLESASSIAVINAKTLKVENVWPIAPGTEPTGLALDNETHRLFSVTANKIMMVVDALSGKIIAELPTGTRTDGAAFDPETKCAFSANGDGTLTVVKEEVGDKYSVLENVITQSGARTIALNKMTHHLYLPTATYTETKGKLAPGSFVVLEISN